MCHLTHTTTPTNKKKTIKNEEFLFLAIIVKQITTSKIKKNKKNSNYNIFITQIFVKQFSDRHNVFLSIVVNILKIFLKSMYFK